MRAHILVLLYSLAVQLIPDLCVLQQKQIRGENLIGLLLSHFYFRHAAEPLAQLYFYQPILLFKSR